MLKFILTILLKTSYNMLSFSRVAHTFLNLTLSVEISDHRRHLSSALTLPRDQLDFCCPTWHLPLPGPPPMERCPFTCTTCHIRGPTRQEPLPHSLDSCCKMAKWHRCL